MNESNVDTRPGMETDGELATEHFDAKRFLAGVPGKPGVYRMLNKAGKVIYVGKAGNLKKRLSSYFVKQHSNPKTALMVSHVTGVELTLTNTESEALILENNLIKALRPRYNVLMRDDKSYPYVYLSTQQTYPRLAFHRGSRRGKGRYFGPYPSAGAVRESLKLLQTVIPVRQCDDSFFRNRSRPCLQYQIERCTAPCVGLISPEDYARDVRLAELFLSGRSMDLVDELGRQMEKAAAELAFERAARLRDQITSLSKVREQQLLEGGNGDLDLLACVADHGVTCVQGFFMRDGRHLGNRAFFPRAGSDQTPAEVLSAFIAQYYLDQPPPPSVLVNLAIDDKSLLEQALRDQHGRRVTINKPQRGPRRQWMQLAITNAQQAVSARLASRASTRARYQALQELLGLPEPPQRLECFDISHTMGEATVASCVVFDNAGPLKSDYRSYNIEGITPGDDYAAMAQALRRRYRRVAKGEIPRPDVLLIDGGRGQLTQAAQVLDEVGISDLCVVGVAKGPDRKPGSEMLLRLGDDQPLLAAAHSPALHLVQHVRDEAHRFAIGGHRQRRSRRRTRSFLEEIPGLGAKRRQALLTHLGGLQGVNRAGIAELRKVPGISVHLAQSIYDYLHND